MEYNYLLLAQLLKMRRLTSGYSKREFARKIDISDTEVSRIENGERQNYNLTTLIKMCEILNLDLVKLLKTCGYLPCEKEEMDIYLDEYIKDFENNKDTCNVQKEETEYCIFILEIES